MTENIVDKMMAWFRGNEDAVRFATDLWVVTKVWDDLVDPMVESNTDDVNDTFRRLIYTIPTNPFYAANAHELAPVMHDMMLQWQIAIKMESDQKDGDLHKAFMLRAGIYQLLVYIASLAVDPTWAAVVGPEIWRTYGVTLEEYVKEMH
jgi:hypothetical protein